MIPLNKRIGFGPRLLAFVIDNFFVVIATLLLLNIFNPSVLDFLSRSQEILQLMTRPPEVMSPDQKELLAGIHTFNSFIAGITIIYMLIEAYTGASPGKRLLSLQIVTPDGFLCPLRLYTRRYVLKNISSLFFILSISLQFPFLLTVGQFMGTVVGLGFLLTLNNQAVALHDIACGTIVIKKQDIQSSPRENE